MTQAIQFKIITPAGVVYKDDEVESVTTPTASGEITVLGKHVPLVTLLRPGEVTLKKSGSTEDVHFAVARGVLEVRPGSEVVALVDAADRAEEIDIEAAERARARAVEALARKDALSDIESAHFQAILDHELARLKVSGKYGRR